MVTFDNWVACKKNCFKYFRSSTYM